MAEHIREYIIEGLLGRGGMGSVFLATHVHLKKKAALKVLLEQFSEDASIKSRFVNEASLLHDLQHKNIVQLREFFEENGRLVLVMEYVDGRPLDKMIGQDVCPIPWEKALPLFIQILDGIGYAHSKGIVHRDIKPANILISKEGQVKVTDLGIAKIAGEQGMTRTGTNLGTPYYESPEQIQGAREVDHRSDIYSLGMTLYEMLAGRLPFDTDGVTSEFKIMSSIVNRTDHLDPREHYPHIPEWLVKVIQKATALDPSKRFQSCEEFRNVLIKYGRLSETKGKFWAGKVATSFTVSSQIESSEGNPDRLFVQTITQGNTNQQNQLPTNTGKYITDSHEIGRASGMSNKVKVMIAVVVVGALVWFTSSLFKNPEVYPSGRSTDAVVLDSLPDDPTVGMEFAVIPSGNYLMGSPASESGRDADESQHRVYIDSFELMTTEITQDMWEFVMDLDIRDQRRYANPSWSLAGEGANYPVYYVNWHECQEFITRLNELDSENNYRLPTEAEWEYAYRAGTTARYYWGHSDSESEMKQHCWYENNADQEEWTSPHASRSGTQPVGTKSPNSWGLFDMSGNVYEWCEDVYAGDYSQCPVNGTAYTGSGTQRINRGGGWISRTKFCRSSFRNSDTPDFRSNCIGFRIVRI